MLICRAIAAQFVDEDLFAMFEFALAGDEVRIVDEKHYWLVPREQISSEDLASYRHRV